MNNNGRAITNASFRRKILDVIDKLKNQSKTAMNPRVDDFEQLNVDVFEDGMAALVQAIESGGGGGGSSNIEVLEYELETSTSKIVTKKTFNEIVALYDAGKAIVMPVHVAIETEGTTMHYRLIVNFGMINNYIEDGQEYWVLYGYSKGPNASTFPVTFFAESATSVMKASIGE